MGDYLTIDVGGTNIKYAVMNENAEISVQGETATPRDDLDHFLAAIKEIWTRFAHKGIQAAVMSAPGRIDSSTGYFYTSGALEYISGINLKERMKEIIPLPFSVENDAKAAALAELWKGTMQDVRNGMVIVLGTGIGGAAVIDGKLYRGSTFAAGEYSLISTRHDLPFSPENIWAQQNGVGSLIARYAERKGLDPEELNGRIFFEKVNEGEPEALDALREYCSGLASVIISLQSILDVERIAIGGGISKQPALIGTLRQVLKEMDEPYEGLMPYTLPEIVGCRFGNDANMIGALYHYLYEMQ